MNAGRAWRRLKRRSAAAFLSRAAFSPGKIGRLKKEGAAEKKGEEEEASGGGKRGRPVWFLLQGTSPSSSFPLFFIYSATYLAWSLGELAFGQKTNGERAHAVLKSNVFDP